MITTPSLLLSLVSPLLFTIIIIINLRVKEIPILSFLNNNL